jgi:GH15 family glucan-1,4-alpha-glucosidase
VLTDPGRVHLGRRAWIGDGRDGASIAPDGTVDWYAAGGREADPDLWRLLDDSGPALRVGPVREDGRARRHLPVAAMSYLPGSNVVKTVTEGAGGRRVAVTDFVPWSGPGGPAGFGPAAGPGGAGGIIRLVQALSGPVEVEVEVLSGPDRHPGGRRRVVAATERGLLMDGLEVGAPERFEAEPVDRDTARWRAVVRLDAGEEAVVTAGCARAVSPDAAHRLLEDTLTAWRSWLSRLAYSGPYRPEVERALLAVGVLTGPSGAVAGAGTTSLPRRIGSERGGDGRWVRLRDVAGGVALLARAGFAEDAEAGETWLRHTITAAHLPWPAWFDQDGQPVPDPEERPWTGWRRSQPVRFGRSPALDAGLLGAVAAAVGSSMRGPGGRRDDAGPLSAALGPLGDAADWLADNWRRPDNGRWEIGSPRRRYVAGRIEAWSAFDRLSRLARSAHPLDLQAAAWHEESREVLAWLENHAVADDGGLRLAGEAGGDGWEQADDPSGSDEADAALLSMVGRGPWPAGHPLVAATVGRILERLSSGGLLYRYSDRVADDQAGPDLPDMEASLMSARALAGMGAWDEAHARVEAVTALVRASGPGLIAETADPVSGQQFGNFPCTAANLALLDAAFALELGPR